MSQMDYKPLTLNPRWSKYYHCPLQTSPYHETNTVKPNQKCKQHTFLLRLKQLQLETFFPLYDFFHCSMDRIMSSSVLHLSCKFFLRNYTRYRAALQFDQICSCLNPF